MMFHWKTLAGGAAVSIMAAAAIVQPVEAQSTASTINGRVVDASGQPIANADVVVQNDSTGSTRTSTTSANGVFFSSGHRVGGPYTISVATEAGSAARENVFLQPGRGNNVTLIIGQEVRTLQTVVVQGAAGTVKDLNNGVGSAYGSDDILNQPATERDIIAVLIRDPLASSNGEGNLSVAGVNPKFNGFAIDGALQSDDFGLSNSTFATARAPINLDAIESVTLEASNYSVTASGFTGGLVNVVTKSGTNEFHGNLFYNRQTEDFIGNTAFDQFIDVAPFVEEEYGFTLGGPIIKDKLFFFGSYDKFDSASGRNFTQQDIDDGVDPALYGLINDIVLAQYGFDLGGRPTTVSNPTTSERIIAKLDWNINQDHRTSFTYQRTEENGTSNVGQTNFTSAYYTTPSTIDAFTGQLFSDWTPNLSTHLRVNYKEFSRAQDCAAGIDVGEFDIRLSEAEVEAFFPGQGLLDDGDGTIETGNDLFLTGGCDRFRQGNTFDDKRLQIFASADYIWGDHLITFGGEYQSYDLDNLFAQRSSGEFRFEDLTQLSTGVADRVEVLNAPTNNREDVRAVWGYNQLSLFAQDSWQVLPNLIVDAGLRYEVFLQSDEPEDRVFFETTYGFKSNQNLDGRDLIMPRFGFQYTPFDRTKVTGGFGLFAGGNPQVWVSNAFTPSLFFAREFNVAGVNPSTGVPASTQALIAANLGTANPLPVDAIDPDFKTPSDWKASLRIDQDFDANFGAINLGENYHLSLQALYTMTNQGFRWENIAQTQLGSSLPTGVAPDGRPIYADLDDLGVDNAILLTNFDDSNSLILSAALSKYFENGFGFDVSYANQNVETTVPGGSSRGVSNFRGIFGSDRNNPTAGTSPFQTEHSFKINFSYDVDIFGDLKSRFNLFGNITSGEPFTYTFDVGSSNPLFGRSGNGEGPFDNDNLYVPAYTSAGFNDPNVVFTGAVDQAAFLEYLQNRGIMGGEIFDTNNDESPWNQRWDFQYTQELPFANFGIDRFSGNKLKFVLNIKNVANLLNDEWGTQFNGPGFDALNIVRADLVTAADVAANGVAGATALTGDAPRAACTTAGSCLYRFTDFDDDPSGFRSLTRSTYEIKAGFRYEF